MSLKRHTTRVYVLRFVLPLIAVIAALAVILWPTIDQFRRLQISKNSLTHARIESIALTAPAAGGERQLQVNKPEFTGLDDEGRPYAITAIKVLQGLTSGSAMTLDQPKAVLTLDRNTAENATLQGKTGLYNPDTKTLELNGDVALTHSNGYVLNMQDLYIDLTQGFSKTKTPVTGQGPAGTLSGETMELRDRGDHMILHGKSKLILNTDKAG